MNQTISLKADEYESKKDDEQFSPEKNLNNDSSMIGLATLTALNDHDRKWVQYVKKIYSAIYNMEKSKYLEPKFSIAL
jgi:hypothetical protein